MRSYKELKKEATYKFLETPGHGYLIVPKEEIINDIKNGIKYTEYSSVVGNKVYLEEDVDTTTFMEAHNLTNDDLEIKYGNFKHDIYPPISSLEIT